MEASQLIASVVEPCSVCLDIFKIDDPPHRLRSCGHVFHLQCIQDWIPRKNICPTCRALASLADVKMDFVLSNVIEKLSNMLIPLVPPQEQKDTESGADKWLSASVAPVVRPRKFTTTAHPHELVIGDPDIVYREFGGRWYCNICHKDGFGTMRHCQPCEFDICESCFSLTAILSVVHPHKLTQVDFAATYPSCSFWFCDICGKRGPPGLMRHCNVCKTFDACEECYHATPVKSNSNHPHLLVKSNPEKVYKGKWNCDKCHKQGYIMYHCYTCNNYDECTLCALSKKEEVEVKFHKHKLKEEDLYRVYNNATVRFWTCGCCRKSATGKMYHCSTCGDFDMCIDCINDDFSIIP